jgi:hypothetical protein
VHHSDRGSQYVSIRYSERLAEAGIEPSVGSTGDSYDNALAETINGLYKAEIIHRRGPWKTREAVELATLEWVSWFNNQRLLEPIGYIPPAEAEANYWRQQAAGLIHNQARHRGSAAGGLNHEYMAQPGGLRRPLRGAGRERIQEPKQPLDCQTNRSDSSQQASSKPGAVHSANPVKAVVFQFCETRSGENVREFLRLDTPGAWQGTLVTDGFSGYKATTTMGVTSAQCMAHSRRKFNDLWANHRSEVGRKALRYYQVLFRIEREVEDRTADDRRRIRQRKSRRVLAVFHRWLLAQRQLVPPGSATMKAIDYSLKRWAQLTRFVDDGDVPISNNWVENQIRPIALGRSNWLFAGSLRAGKRAAAVMSLLHSARINGHEPYAYIRDVLERLPTHPSSRIDELLPHRWSASA